MNQTSNLSAKAAKAKKFNMKAVTGSHTNNNIGSAIDVSSNTIIASNNGINFKNCNSTKVGQPHIATGNLVGNPVGTLITPKTHLMGT
jgi:hypothetical protein